MDMPEETAPAAIAGLIRDMGPSLFLPNKGNMGDLVIAEAIRDFFTRYGLDCPELDRLAPPAKYKLVYGGGGVFTSQWIGTIDTTLITGPQVEQCIILPCSMTGVDGFVRGLDERHTVICRERRTYGYLARTNPRIRLLMGSDMALQLDVPAVLEGRLLPDATCGEGKQIQGYAEYLLQNRFAGDMASMVRCSTVTAPLGGRKRRIAFILRTDAEDSAGRISAPGFADVSALFCTRCLANKYNKRILQAMANALMQADVIVSDRLHVCIMSHLTGREVYMLDNNYGKLSGVYDLSLRHAPGVHCLAPDTLPPELYAAWKKRVSAACRLRFRMAALRKRLRALCGKINHRLCKLLRRQSCA